MEKKILFLVILFLIISKVNAKVLDVSSFKEEYFYKITSKDGITKLKPLKKVEDEKGVSYYDITPNYGDLEITEFKEEMPSLEKEQLKSISKIIYYGYGYKDHKSDNYYYATQYLIYKTFEDIDIAFYDNKEEIELFKKEILEISNLIDNKIFTLEDESVKNTLYTIKDEDILNNFKVEGNHLNTNINNKEININLLDELDDYVIHFKAKNDCSNIKTLKSNVGLEYIHMDSICEKDYQINLHYEKEVLDNTINEEEQSNEEEIVTYSEVISESVDEDAITVSVPSTSKSDATISSLILLGALFYGIKIRFFAD